MNTLVHEAVKASPYGGDPVGTRRPLLDFMDPENPDKFLEGYARAGNALTSLFNISPFGDDRDDIIGEREVVVAVVHAEDGADLSQEAWVAFWNEDGNDPSEDGSLTVAKTTVVRIA